MWGTEMTQAITVAEDVAVSVRWPRLCPSGYLIDVRTRFQREKIPGGGASGTASSAFVGASLQHLIAAARLPNSGISEVAVNASLAFIEGAKPRDEIECALVIQMACTHSAAMSVLGTFAGANGYGRDVPLKASAAARLMRAYATQVETLRRLRNGGSQVVRVEHVHVNEGGQAVIGHVNSIPGSGR
jgi:hypothetical protein